MDEATALEWLFEIDPELAAGIVGDNLYLEEQSRGVWRVYDYADRLLDEFEVIWQ